MNSNADSTLLPLLSLLLSSIFFAGWSESSIMINDIDSRAKRRPWSSTMCKKTIQILLSKPLATANEALIPCYKCYRTKYEPCTSGACTSRDSLGNSKTTWGNDIRIKAKQRFLWVTNQTLPTAKGFFANFLVFWPMANMLTEVSGHSLPLCNYANNTRNGSILLHYPQLTSKSTFKCSKWKVLGISRHV